MKKYYETNPGSFYGRHHTEETKKTIAERARYNAKNKLNGWKSGSNKIQNKYELFTWNFLKSNNIDAIPEYVVPNGHSYYQLDFLVNGNIDLEIDGSGHNFAGDEKRDLFIKNKKHFEIYHIRHNDSIDELKIKLNQFINSINK